MRAGLHAAIQKQVFIPLFVTSAENNVTSLVDVVRMTTNYYKVYGATAREVRESINRLKPWKGPQSMDAQTDWAVRAKYSVGDAGGVSRLPGPNVRSSKSCWISSRTS